jgi:hypothetical protein
MLGPPGANGPQKWLQHWPQPLQSVPSTEQVVEMDEHVPADAPAAMVHTPVQQSRSRAHTSPVWMQNDAASAQAPFWHRPEQHAPGVPAEQGFPAVRHELLSGWQTLPLQFWLQHSVELPHAWWSATQLAAVEQT